VNGYEFGYFAFQHSLFDILRFKTSVAPLTGFLPERIMVIPLHVNLRKVLLHVPKPLFVQNFPAAGYL